MQILQNLMVESQSDCWHEAAYYATLTRADRRRWAWFWLKRNADYTLLARHNAALSKWRRLAPKVWESETRAFENLFAGGALLSPEGDPSDRCDTPILWMPSHDPSVIVVDTEPSSPRDQGVFELSRFRDIATVLKDRYGREMLLLGEGRFQIQIMVERGTLLNGPVKLRYRLDGCEDVNAKIATMNRLHVLIRKGQFQPSQFPTDPHGAKWIRMLQAWDGVVAGASQREIACVIYGNYLVENEWNGRSDFLRSRMQRLINQSRQMVATDYARLLTGTHQLLASRAA